MPTKKYFIAVIPPSPVFEEIEAIKCDLEKHYGLKGALRSPAHITLHRPFEWKEEKEPELLLKLQQFKHPLNFEIRLRNFAFFEPRVIYVDVLPNQELKMLNKELAQFAKRELKLFNEADDMRGFLAHVTVAFRDLKKKLFYELREDFLDKKIEGAFTYKGFSLLKLEKKWEVLRNFV